MSPEPARAEAVEAYIEVVCGAHHTFIGELQRASSLLARCEGTLPGVAAVHQRLVRDVLDAHRTILRHRAEVDVEVDRLTGRPARPVTTPDSDIEDVQVARLRRVLDAWWWSEVEAGERLLAAASSSRIEAERAPTDSWPAPALIAGDADTPMSPSALPDDLLERLDDGDGATLPELLDQLLDAYPSPTLDAVPQAATVDPLQAERDRFESWLRSDETEPDAASHAPNVAAGDGAPTNVTWLRKRSRRTRAGR